MSLLSLALALQLSLPVTATTPDSVRSPFVHPWQVELQSAMLQADLDRPDGDGLRLVALPARLRLGWNGELPREAHESELWVGRGLSTSLRGGVGMRRGPFVLLLVPEIAWSQNRPFDLLASRDSTRSAFASPLNTSGVHSLDLPLRPGMHALARMSPGWSALYADVAIDQLAGRVRGGLTASPLAWGPSWRNGLLLSVHGPGIPRIFVEGEHVTSWGTAHWQLFGGVLTESLFFDRDATNDQRALGGAALAFAPVWLPGIQLGFGRLSLQPTGGTLSLGELLASPFRGSAYASRTHENGSVVPPQADALAMAFARWSHAEHGVTLGIEMAWQEPPTGLRDLLSHSAHTRAFTLSAQWQPPEAHPWAGYARVEVTSLDLERVRFDRPAPADFYSGRAAIQGFTQRGRLLGAVVGPGGQSLWAEAGMPVTAWLTAGAHLGWSRFNNDAFTRERWRNFNRRDSALEAGLRVGLDWRGQQLVVEGGAQRRINYLFQNGFANPLGIRTVSLTNPFVSLAFDWRP